MLCLGFFMPVFLKRVFYILCIFWGKMAILPPFHCGLRKNFSLQSEAVLCILISLVGKCGVSAPICGEKSHSFTQKHWNDTE